MTTPTQGEHAQTEAQPIQRFEVVDCIDSKHVPAVIPRKDGPWVRYEDHAAQVAALTAAQPAAPQGVAYAELPEPAAWRWKRRHTDKWTYAEWDGIEAEAAQQMRDQGYYAVELLDLRASHGQAPASRITVEQVEDAVGLQSTAWDTIGAEKIVEAVLRLANGQAPAGAADEMEINRPFEDPAPPFNQWRGEMQSALKRAGVYAARSPGAGNKLTLRWRTTREDVLPTPTVQAAPALAENGHLTQAGHDLLMEATLSGATLVSKGRLVGDMAQAESQPAPVTQQAVGNSGFDHKTAADFLSGKTVSDEALRKFVATSRGAHDDRAALLPARQRLRY